jgi:DNA-binding GntR family transcriptional regulator
MTRQSSSGLNSKLNSKHSEETRKYGLYSQIKEAIITSEYSPGTILIERALCEKYDISRTPVREVLRQLANEGLIELIPRKGAFVSKIAFEDMIEIFEVREALERQAIKLFILKDDGSMEEKLKQCFDAQLGYVETAPDKNMEKDMEFHFLIAEGARNKRLFNSLETIYDQIKMLAISVENDRNLRKMAESHHKKVLEAILKHDVELGERCIVEHIIEVKNYHISKYITSS